MSELERILKLRKPYVKMYIELTKKRAKINQEIAVLRNQLNALDRSLIKL